MNINRRRLNDVTLLDLDGNFVLGEQWQFGYAIAADIDAGGRKLIVNLENVRYVDSTGVGQLILGYNTMRRADGDFKLLHLQQHLMKLLVVTKLFTVFEAFDSESAALSSFPAALESSPD